MFSQYSIRQLLLATAGVAIFISIVATGIRQDNPMGWGTVASLALLPVLFLVYGVVTVCARVFCEFGNTMLGPLDTAAFTNVVVKRLPVMPDQEPDSDPASTEATDEE